MTTVDVDPIAPQMANEGDRLDVPGVVDSFMLMGSVKHATDEQLLKNLQVSCIIDAENPRKRSAHPELAVEPTIDVGRVELDDDFSYDEFKSNVMDANKLIQTARSDNKTVFVFCTHGNNESAVVCIAFLMVVEQWTLEHAYRHVLQKRPASAPRKAYVEKLRTLELEVHGRVTLRSDQIGPSMIDIMLGLRGQSPVDDTDELSSQTTDGGASTIERASNMSNFSVVTGRTNGRSVRETMIIAEQEDEPVATGKDKVHSPSFGRRKSKAHRTNVMMFEKSNELPQGMNSVYDWVDQFSFSRPMKNTARDFSDAVLLAEILAQLCPAWVQLHNYPSTHRFQQKLSNWEALNRKVLTRLKCGISVKHQEDLANAVPGAIELLLIQVKRATAKSPFLHAKRALVSQTEAVSTSPRSRASSTPSPEKQKPSSSRKANSKKPLLSSPLSLEHDSVSTSFSKLLQMMSDTTDEFEDTVKPVQSRNRANTAPVIQPTSLLRAATLRPLTPNYAKPTKSTKAMMARSSSVDAKPRTSSFKVSQKVAKTRIPENLQEDKAHLPSDTNEFQEDSFVYFSSSEALPVAYSSGSVEDQAQVARVIKTLPSGECTLQLYRRVPSLANKTRCYFATPHSIDCCSTLLHTVPNMAFDPQTNTCEWPNRSKKPSSDAEKEPQATPNEPLQAQRCIYTEVLARVTFTLVKLAEPIRMKESVSLRLCLPCPRFAESFSVPIEPTVFPKVQVSLLFELPERFPR